ncbi:MAG: SNF2-related protein [Streptosporangiaceae bacterium]|nr:SNF2-related protein [Streptosporangiaceae bacterium]
MGLVGTAWIGSGRDATAGVQEALSVVRAGVALRELGSIAAERLRDVTDGRLRLGALERSGYATVLQVLDATPYRLQLPRHRPGDRRSGPRLALIPAFHAHTEP